MEKLIKNNLGQWSIKEESLTKAIAPSTNYSGTHEAKVDDKWYRIKNMGVDNDKPIVSHKGENWYELEGHPEGSVHQGRIEDYNIVEPKAKVDDKWYNVKNMGVNSDKPIVSHQGENWYELEGHPEGSVHQGRVQDYNLGSKLLDKTELNLDDTIKQLESGNTTEPDFPVSQNEMRDIKVVDKQKIIKKPKHKQESKTNLVKSEEEMEKGIKSTLATGLAGISMLAGNTARADMKSDLDNIANKQQATLSTPAAQAQSKKFVQDSAGASLKDMQSSHVNPSKSNTSSVHYSPSDPATSKLFNQSLEAHLNDLGAVKTGGTWTHSEHNMGPLLEIAKQRAAGGHPSVGVVQKSLDEKLEQLEKALGDLKKANPNTWVVTNSNGKNIETTSPAATGEAPHIKIGTTTTGKPVMSTHKDSYYKSFTPNEHREAFTIHGKLRQNLEGKHPSQMNTSLINHYKQMEAFHDQGARIKD